MGNFLAEFLAKIRALFGSSEAHDDFSDEIEHHIESIAQRNIAAGMNREDSLVAARREFGNPARTAEKARESWRFQPVDELQRDLRFCWRGMRRAPVLAAVIIVTLALGIGANTAIFSVVHAVLIEPLPYPAAERLLWMGESTRRSPGISVTWLNYRHWLEENHSFEGMAAFALEQRILSGGRELALIRTATVTSEFPMLVGMTPQVGRVLSPSDDAPGAAAVAVLSDEFWRRHFQSDASVIHSTLNLDGKAYQVVGVAGPLWQYFGRDADLFVPLGPERAGVIDRSRHGSMRVLGRMKTGVTTNQARMDLDQIMDRLSAADPGPENGHRSYVQPLAETVTGDVRSSLWALMGAVGLLLLIACGNVAALLVARNLSRYSEIAIRMAIGAGRARLIRELLTESLAFATIGGACGVMLAYWCLRVLIAFAPSGIPRLANVSVHGDVLAFAVGATALTGLLAGLAPVWSALRGVHLTEAMQGATRSATSSGRSLNLRGVLVAGQIGITLVLVFVAGVLLRSLAEAHNRNPGFEPRRLLAMELSLPPAAYPGSKAQLAFYDQLRTGIAALPGVESEALVNGPPALGARMDWFYSITGKPVPRRGEVPVAILNVASPGYFATAGISLRGGREFTSVDRLGAPCVAVVNETLARGRDAAIGYSIKIGGPYMAGSLCQIIGVAADVSQEGLDSNAAPEIFLPLLQTSKSAMVEMIRMRSDGDAEPLIREIRTLVGRLGPGVPIQSLKPVTVLLEATLERRRFGTMLLTSFAGLAFALAAIGIYGLLDFWVGMRRREIALRLVLGASRGAILRFTGWQTARLVLAGCVAGVCVAYVSSNWLENLAFGTAAKDPRVLGAAVCAILALGGAASAIPLWRAARINESEQLHRS